MLSDVKDGRNTSMSGGFTLHVLPPKAFRPSFVIKTLFLESGSSQDNLWFSHLAVVDKKGFRGFFNEVENRWCIYFEIRPASSIFTNTESGLDATGPRFAPPFPDQRWALSHFVTDPGFFGFRPDLASPYFGSGLHLCGSQGNKPSNSLDSTSFGLESGGGKGVDCTSVAVMVISLLIVGLDFFWTGIRRATSFL